MKKSRKGKSSMVIMVLVLVVVIGLSGCATKKNKEEVPKLKEPVGVDIDTAKVERKDFGSVNSYQGEVVPDVKGLYFVNSGQIASVKVDIGDKVKKGQLLATLKGADSDIKELQTELQDALIENKEINATNQNKIEQMKVELQQLKSKKEKAKKVKEKKAFEKQIVAKQEEIKTARLDAKMQKETQQLQLSNLREDLAQAKKKNVSDKLYSSVNGEVVSTTLSVNDFVTGGNVVMYVADMDKTRIRTDFIASTVVKKASSYHAVINGKEYEVEMEEQELSGLEVEMGETPSNTYFDYSQDANVSVGDSVSVEFYNDMAEDALIVPSNAVYKNKQEYYVYRMTNNNREKVMVTTGTQTDAYTQITSGLKEGDVVYVQN